MDDTLLVRVKKIADACRQDVSYNLFSVLGIETKEVLICRVLADLLNPGGQHGMGSAYLELFLKEVFQCQTVHPDRAKRAVVTAEYRIDEDRRIDLVIEIAGHFIPMEVKILAGEQQAQCLDYYRFGRAKDLQTKVIYLTRFGTMPGAYSLSDGTDQVPEKDLICISFQKHIIHWLEQCRNVSRDEMKPMLTQFLDTIRKITGITKEHMTDMTAQEIAGSADSLRAAIQISDSLNAAKEKVLRSVMEEFAVQMKPLEQKYHLEREQNIDWYGYEKQIASFYDHAYSTYPGLNYMVKDAVMIRTYQLWLRIEVDNRLFAGFCVFDPAASSKEGQGNQVDEYDPETRACVNQILNVTKADQSAWWAVWRYLPTGSVKESPEVPDFKAMNNAAIALADAEVRKEFVAEAVKRMEESLFSLMNKQSDRL